MAQKTTVTVSLDTEADKDLIRWLERQENRSAAIREAIRDHLGHSGITLGDVYQAVKALERKLGTGAVVVTGDADGERIEEPPGAAAALDALAELGS
jgi:hypothetical protein